MRRGGVGGNNPQLFQQKVYAHRRGEGPPDSVHVPTQHLISVTARNTLPRRATPRPPPTCRREGGMQMASRVVPDSAQLPLPRLRADVAAGQASPLWGREQAGGPRLSPATWSRENELAPLPGPRPFPRPHRRKSCPSPMGGGRETLRDDCSAPFSRGVGEELGWVSRPRPDHTLPLF